MSERISTKAGVFESGEKDAQSVQYKDGRLIACRNNKLENYTVAEGTEVICDRAFMNQKDLKSVILPDTLKAIGESAFSGCKALADIDIPEGVTEIRQATFRDCDSLAALELPASVTEIEKFAFGRVLTTLVVNAPKVKIDKYAFMNARDLSTLMVPAGSADYYRNLLADMRVEAEVEEMEEKAEEPASLLDAFMADPEKVAEETNNIYKSNNNMDDEKNLISKIKETHDNETDQILILLNTDNGQKKPEVYINQLEHCGDDSDPEPFFQKTRHSSWVEENILEEGKEYSEEEIAQLMFANYRVLLDEYRHNLQYHIHVQFSFIIALDKQIIAIEEAGLLDYANKLGYFTDEDQDFLKPAYVEEKTKECAAECAANAADFIPGPSEDNSQEHNEKKKVTLRLWGEGMRLDVLDSAGDVIDCINALRKGELFEISAIEGDSEFAVPLDEIDKSLGKRDDDDEDYDGGFDEWYEYEDFLDEPEDSYEDVEKINMVQTKVYGNVVIELSVEESFDIHQIRLMWTEIALPDAEEEIYCGVLYKGKSYPIVLDIDSEREISVDEVWCR